MTRRRRGIRPRSVARTRQPTASTRLRRDLAPEQPPCASRTDLSTLAAIVEACPVALVYLDRRTGSIWLNGAAGALFGHQPAPACTAPGAIIQQIRYPAGEPVADHEALLNRALGGEACAAVERLIIRANGEKRPVLESASPVLESTGEIVGAVGAFQDISPLADARQRLEDWVSLIAHDLRQPVTVITGFASLLLRLHEGPLSSVEQEAVRHIWKSAGNLNRMVADLLDMTRLEAGRLALQLQAEDLSRLVEAIVDRAMAVVDDHPVQVVGDLELPPVTLDAQRFEQILLNLLSNAAKYGDLRTAIEVRVARRESRVEVSVANQGPGILPDELPQLFTRFYRTRAAIANRTPGLGLGLYLTRRLVEAHGGQIRVESQPGQLTTFTVSLPISGPAAETRQGPGRDS